MAVAALVGCAARQKQLQPLTWTSRVPEASSSGWWRLQTPHFTLYTDHRADVAREAADALEREWIALGAIMGNSPAPHGHPVKIYVLADGLEFERLFGRTMWGFMARGPDVDSVFLYGPPDRWIQRTVLTKDENASVLQHELAHLVLYQRGEVTALYFPAKKASAWGTDRPLPMITFPSRMRPVLPPPSSIALAFAPKPWSTSVASTCLPYAVE
jgi:hypothetical protein